MNEVAPRIEAGADYSKLKKEKLLSPVNKVEKRRPGNPERSKSDIIAEARFDIVEAAPESRATVEALKSAAQEDSPASHPMQVDRDLKSITLRRELNHVRRKLPARDRALSKVVHQPVVLAISEAAGKTISRPSGMFGGGLVAFLGTSSYLYLARHMGFEYNSFVFIALFAGGFVFGLILELLIHLATAKHRQPAA